VGSASTASAIDLEDQYAVLLFRPRGPTASLLGVFRLTRDPALSGHSNSCVWLWSTCRSRQSTGRQIWAIGEKGKEPGRPRRGGSPRGGPKPIPGWRHGRAGSRNARRATCQRGTGRRQTKPARRATGSYVKVRAAGLTESAEPAAGASSHSKKTPCTRRAFGDTPAFPEKASEREPPRLAWFGELNQGERPQPWRRFGAGHSIGVRRRRCTMVEPDSNRAVGGYRVVKPALIGQGPHC